MVTTVKRAISLPKEQDKELQRISKERGAPYSRLVQAAIQVFLDLQERGQLERAYERYYADKESTRRTKQLARDFGASAPGVWP